MPSPSLHLNLWIHHLNGGQENRQFSFIYFLYSGFNDGNNIIFTGNCISCKNFKCSWALYKDFCSVLWSAHRQIWQTATRHVASYNHFTQLSNPEWKEIFSQKIMSFPGVNILPWWPKLFPTVFFQPENSSLHLESLMPSRPFPPPQPSPTKGFLSWLGALCLHIVSS